MTKEEEAERSRLIDRIETLEARVFFLEGLLSKSLDKPQEDFSEYLFNRYIQ